MGSALCAEFVVLVLSKGNALPCQPWTVPKDSRRLRLPDFKTVGT